MSIEVNIQALLSAISASIRKLVIEDVRCFAGRQEFNIRPLTFLVGENSTGKSTALGCFQTLHNFTSVKSHGLHFLDFNNEPYQMGAFTDIVRKATPKKKRFTLGFEFGSGGKEEKVEYFLTLIEKEKGSEPIGQEQKLIFPNSEVVLVDVEQEAGWPDTYHSFGRLFTVVDFSEEDGNKKFRIGVFPSFLDTSVFEILSDAFEYIGYRRSIPQREQKNLLPMEKEFQIWMESVWDPFRKKWHGSYGRYSYSFAPIRSKPQRTYNPLKETISPEGSDIPMMLMNMFRTNEKEWKELKERLIEFGKSSGLFSDIHVRRLGKSVGDPFQLQIKVKGPKANMIDVGYGVNQLLPILVRIFEAREETTFLMQQPEVHLHPRGQAELSSLFTALVKQRRHNFIIETHSDAMISRARIEIMNKRIAPEDVSLIYLEPVGNRVMAHNIRFDEQANLLDAPNGYREFFLHESDKLLGFIEG